MIDASPTREEESITEELVPIAPWPEGAGVYFVRRAGEPEKVKIGVAKNVADRLRFFQTMDDRPLELLAVEPGAQPLERAHHTRWCAHRLCNGGGREWFTLVPEIKRHILMLRREAVALSISKAASTALRDQARSTDESSLPAATTFEVLMTTGSQWWGRTFKGRDIDDVRGALDAATSSVDQFTSETEKLFLLSRRGQDTIIELARWAHAGFQAVRYTSEKFAAMLMASKVSEDVSIHAPWPAFMLHMPPGLLWILDDMGRRQDIDHVLVNFLADDKVRWWATTKCGVSSHRLCVTSELAARSRKDEVEDFYERAAADDAMALSPNKHTARLAELIGRLIQGTCLTAAYTPDMQPQKVRGTASSIRPWRIGRDGPEAMTWRMGRDIREDCRPAVYAFLSGDKHASPTVQFMVIGHWRNQACGVGRAERRPTWIKAHWKGAIDAPINVRSHALSSEEGGV